MGTVLFSVAVPNLQTVYLRPHNMRLLLLKTIQLVFDSKTLFYPNTFVPGHEIWEWDA